jgi:hypothetical protein
VALEPAALARMGAVLWVASGEATDTFERCRPLLSQHRPPPRRCSPGVYQLWLYLLNELLREQGLGNSVRVDPAQQNQA